MFILIYNIEGLMLIKGIACVFLVKGVPTNKVEKMVRLTCGPYLKTYPYSKYKPQNSIRIKGRKI